jgi:hypothetical protein
MKKQITNIQTPSCSCLCYAVTSSVLGLDVLAISNTWMLTICPLQICSIAPRFETDIA